MYGKREGGGGSCGQGCRQVRAITRYLGGSLVHGIDASGCGSKYSGSGYGRYGINYEFYGQRCSRCLFYGGLGGCGSYAGG